MRCAVWITWSLLFFCLCDALAQPLTVRGYVPDAPNDNSLSGNIDRDVYNRLDQQ